MWKWANFSREEMKGPMDPSFMDRLQRLRDSYGKPMRVTSAYRSPIDNVKVSTTGATGPHTTGRAVDFQIPLEDVLEVIYIAKTVGFTGVGLKQHGSHNKRFIHLDDLPDAPGQPRPRVWTYG